MTTQTTTQLTRCRCICPNGCDCGCTCPAAIELRSEAHRRRDANGGPIRIQRRRAKGWTLSGAADPFRGGVIVSRPSRFGNPCKVGLMQEMGYEDPHAAAADNFRIWLAGARSDAPTDEADRRRERILADLHLLRGKDLACTCRPDQACHADELLRRANMPAAELAAWVAVVRARVDRQRVRDGEQPLHPTSAAA